jgi:glycosyltransferase involved in cell wall biosynthesis
VAEGSLAGREDEGADDVKAADGRPGDAPSDDVSGDAGRGGSGSGDAGSNGGGSGEVPPADAKMVDAVPEDAEASHISWADLLADVACCMSASVDADTPFVPPRFIARPASPHSRPSTADATAVAISAAPADATRVDPAASTESARRRLVSRGVPADRAGVMIAVPWDQPDGGVAAVVGNLATFLRERGHPVVFVHPDEVRGVVRRTTAWGFTGYALNLRCPRVDGHPLRAPAAFAATLPATVLALRTIARRHRVRVVNVHYPVEAFGALAMLRAIGGVRLVTSVHGSDVLPNGAPRRCREPAVRAQLGMADLVVAPSQGYLDGLLRHFPAVAGRCAVIHNGIDLAALDRAAQTVDIDRPYVLSVASLTPWKGVDTLLHAFARIARERPSLRLVVVGEGPDRAALETLARELGIANRVEMPGEIPAADVYRLMHGCTLFALASRAEAFGLALAEAMACGRPVVATTAGGIPEVVDAGRTGLLVPPDDPPALAAAMESLLANPSLAGSLAAEARRDVRQRFARERTGEAYAAWFDRLLS